MFLPRSRHPRESHPKAHTATHCTTWYHVSPYFSKEPYIARLSHNCKISQQYSAKEPQISQKSPMLLICLIIANTLSTTYHRQHTTSRGSLILSPFSSVFRKRAPDFPKEPYITHLSHNCKHIIINTSSSTQHLRIASLARLSHLYATKEPQISSQKAPTVLHNSPIFPPKTPSLRHYSPIFL